MIVMWMRCPEAELLFQAGRGMTLVCGMCRVYRTFRLRVFLSQGGAVAAASVSQRPPKPVQPAKGYVAGESVEFDIAAEDEEQGEQSQMELF